MLDRVLFEDNSFAAAGVPIKHTKILRGYKYAVPNFDRGTKLMA